MLEGLLQAPEGDDGFSCMLGLLDKRDEVTFVRSIVNDTFRKRETYRIAAYDSHFLLDEVRYWAAGEQRGEAPEWIRPIAAERLDPLATERIFYREPMSVVGKKAA